VYKKYQEPRTTLTTCLNVSTRKRLDVVLARLGMGMTEVVELLITEFVAEEERIYAQEAIATL
jgi:antitoxin component of RelBE/YafQ-DinJ toxin-antitoxin module